LVKVALLEHPAFTSVQVKVYAPYCDTVTMAVAEFASGAKVTVPGPVVFVHVPTPIPGTA
jgi:hypothetical protein